MDDIKLYEIEESYIEYLSDFEPHLFLNKKKEQKNSKRCNDFKKLESASEEYENNE